MALVTQGWQLHVVLTDQGGNQSTLRFDLTTADHTTSAVARTAILAALAAVTDCAITAHYLREAFQEDAVVFGTGEGENIASISARIDNAAIKYATVKIPAGVAGLYQAASGPLYNVVDPADAALITYLELWETAGEALLSDGEALDSPSTAGHVTGKRIHRGSRKG